MIQGIITLAAGGKAVVAEKSDALVTEHHIRHRDHVGSVLQIEDKDPKNYKLTFTGINPDQTPTLTLIKRRGAFSCGPRESCGSTYTSGPRLAHDRGYYTSVVGGPVFALTSTASGERLYLFVTRGGRYYISDSFYQRSSTETPYPRGDVVDITGQFERSGVSGGKPVFEFDNGRNVISDAAFASQIASGRERQIAPDREPKTDVVYDPNGVFDFSSSSDEDGPLFFGLDCSLM